MVSQVLANARQVVDSGDAEGFQLTGGADARVHKEEGGADGPGGKDCFRTSNGKGLPAAFGFQAHAPLPFKEESAHRCATAHGEVESVSNGVEVRHGGVDPYAAHLVQ